MVSAKWTSITRENFSQLLPEVLEAIKTATFIAFDTELTGLQLTRAHKNSNLDDLVSRYAKLRESVSNFGLLQVGLSCFKWNESKQKYKISAYSFYVFPSAANGLQQERKFTCQLGSLTFLSEFKFDFNKAFHQGIPFITRREESIIKSNSVFYQADTGVDHQKPSTQQKPLILLKDEERAIVNEVFDKIDEWLLTAAHEEESSSSSSSSSSSIDLPMLNSFQRLIFYQQIPLKYGETLALVKKPSGQLSVKRASLDPESRALAFQEEKAQFERALEEQIGFRRVIDQLIEAGKPVVGHNCWVDLLHFYQKFIDNNLPSSISGFKEEILKCFPLIIDTKYLARLVNIKESSLGDLTALASTFPEKSFFSKGVDDESSTNLFHDAGFDAICTGRVFLCLLSHHLRPKEELQVALNASLEILLQNDLLCNRLNVLQSDYPHLNLKGIDLEPDRSGVLYFYNFPSNNNSISSIQGILQSLLRVSHKISCQVSWLNEASAACFVQFEQVEQANDVLEAFKQHEEEADNTSDKSNANTGDNTTTDITNDNSSSPKRSYLLLNRIKITTYRQYQERRDQLLSEDQQLINSKKRRL